MSTNVATQQLLGGAEIAERLLTFILLEYPKALAHAVLVRVVRLRTNDC